MNQVGSLFSAPVRSNVRKEVAKVSKKNAFAFIN